VFGGSSKTIEVSVRMLDGAMLRGTLNMGTNPTLEAILSKDTPFLEFASKDGQRKFLAKHQIAYVEPVEPLRKVVLEPRDSRFTNCYSVLGVRDGAGFDEAKAAYHALAKIYHPDKWQGVELPPEMAKYVNDMFKQINTALTEIRTMAVSKAA
jgi:hypothetical protein